jgi:hypothetical protein
MWPIHRLIEARLFETTKRSHLEGYNIDRSVSPMLNKKLTISKTYAKPKEGI